MILMSGYNSVSNHSAILRYVLDTDVNEKGKMKLEKLSKRMEALGTLYIVYTHDTSQVLCAKCWSPYGRGLSHNCSVKTRRSNAQQIIPETLKQQITNQVFIQRFIDS